MKMALARAALWSAAIAFFAWSIGGVSSAAGASIGGATGILLRQRPLVPIGGRQLSPVLAVMPAALFFAALLPWAFAFFAQPAFSLALANALPSLFLALAFVWCVAAVSERFEGFRFAEPCAIAFALAWPFLPASGGNYVRPQWLSDPALEHGFALTDALSYAGLVAALICLAVLLLPTASGGETRLRFSRWAGILGRLLLVALAVGIGWFVANHLAPVSVAPSTPPPPPVSFSGDPPPPPPPQPLPVAAVQLDGAYLPPARLGAYFFRAPDPVENGPAPTLERSHLPQARVLEAKIYYLDDKAAPLALAGPASVVDFRPPGSHFKKAQTFRSLLPIQSDFSPSSVGDLLRLSLKEPEIDLQPVDEQLTSVLAEIDSMIAGAKPAPPESRLAALASSSRAARQWSSSPSLQATAIIDWIEQNGEFSAKSSAPEEPAEFAKSGLKGGSKNFANLAVALMRARGIKSRTVEGYVITAEKEPTDRIVITDGHRDSWPEIQLADGQWIPWPVRPKKVSDRDEPPPKEDLKDELFAAIEQEKPAPSPATVPAVAHSTAAPTIASLALLLCAVSLAMLGAAVKYFFLPAERIARVEEPKRHRAALQEVAKLGTQLFRPRQFGESWQLYAASIGREFPRAGSALCRLLDEHARAENGFPPSRSWPELYRRTAFQICLSRLIPRHKQNESTNPKLRTA